MESWKAVPFDPRYEVSNIGRVRDALTGKVKKLSRRPDGYLVATLRLGPCKWKTHLVHRLVLLTFVGAPPTEGRQGAHWDGDKANNAVNNLRWATQSENNLDKKRHGTFTSPRHYGEKNPKAKLTPDKVRAIRRLRQEEARSLRWLSREFGVAPHSIRMIILRKHWAHV